MIAVGLVAVVLWFAGGLCLIGLSLLGALDERVSAPGGVLVRRPRDNEEAALDYMKTEYVEGRVDLELLETALEFVFEFERPEEVSGVYAFALARQKLSWEEERALPPRDEEWEAEAAARARATNFHQEMASAMVAPLRGGPSATPVPIAAWSSTGSSLAHMDHRHARDKLRSLGVVFPEDK